MEMRARKSTARGKQVAQSSTPSQAAQAAKGCARPEGGESQAGCEGVRQARGCTECHPWHCGRRHCRRSRALAAPEEEVVEPSEEPSPEDLEEVEKETAKAIGDLERNDRSMLGRYFREMANHRVLAPDEELEAARRIHQLEVAYWRALFSHLPAFETVARVLELAPRRAARRGGRAAQAGARRAKKALAQEGAGSAGTSCAETLVAQAARARRRPHLRGRVAEGRRAPGRHAHRRARHGRRRVPGHRRLPQVPGRRARWPSAPSRRRRTAS